MIIGSHVKMGAPDYLVGSVKEALSYGANTFMFYTGAPQNTRRKPVSELKVDEAKTLMKEYGIDLNNIVVHAPYIINLANVVKEETRELAISFFKEEIKRCEAIGATRLVLHPGSHVKAGEEVGLKAIVDGLNEVLTEEQSVKIALETMAGKGSELACNFEQIHYIIENVRLNDKLGVCLDTCHIHDAGYDLSDFNKILDDFDRIIGLDRLLVIHVNDSKNECGAHKDMHENIGYGYIGFDYLNQVVHHPLLENIPKILETPYIDGNPPYEEEIEMFRNNQFKEIK